MADAHDRHRTIAAAGVGAAAASETVLAALGQIPGYSVHEVAPGRIVISRTSRPRWAVVAAATTFWLLGLGLLFLLVRRTEAGEIVVTDGPRGCVVAIPPVVGAAAVHDLEDALRGSPARSVSAPAVAAAPVPPMSAARRDDGLDDRTVARSAVTEAPTPPAPTRHHLVLRFVEGEVVVEPGVPVVLGRDPSPDGTTSAVPVPVAGAEAASVSKTHLRIAWDGQRATAEDLGSTNGSTIVRAGQAAPLAPGQATEIAEGDELRLGAVSCRVEVPAR